MSFAKIVLALLVLEAVVHADDAPPAPVSTPPAATPPSVAPPVAGCTKDTDCKGDRICDAGVCREPNACTKDTDCPGNAVCSASTCTVPATVVAPAPPPPSAPGVVVSMPEQPPSGPPPPPPGVIGKLRTGFAWELAGGASGTMVIDENDNTSNYFVLYEQAAIGGYVSSNEKRAHAIMVLEDYRHIFVSGGTVGAYFLGLGYRGLTKLGSMSYYLGVASVPDIDAIGFGYRMQWMITGKEGRFGLHINVGVDLVSGSMPACSFCEDPLYILPFVGVGLGGMR